MVIAMSIDDAGRRLERWAQTLLGEMPRDRWIDRAADDEVLAVPLEPAVVAAALADGAPRAVIAIDDAAGAADALASGALPATGDGPAVARRLQMLLRAAKRGELEADAVTWLALGSLWWSVEADAARVRRAPLLVMPVVLRPGANGAIAIARAGAIRVNTALVDAVRREAGVELPAADADPADVAVTLTAIAVRVAEARPAWAVERATYLMSGSLAAVTLAADLTDRLAGAPLVKKLCSSDRAPRLPALPPPPALPLDADAEQTAVVAAALAGHSVVVHAPPGAGAAQTAANLAAAAIGEGKTVLVVGARAAALRGVRRHLARIGIGDFCLDLGPFDDAHALAARLAAVAGRTWRPGVAALGAIDRRDQLAAQLDTYTDELHAPTALGITMFDAVSRLIELRAAPRFSPRLVGLAGMDATELGRRKIVVAEYARAATAVAPIAIHPWRAATPPETVAGEEVGAALDAASHAAGELARRIAAITALIPGLAPRRRADLEAAGRVFAIALRTPRPGADLIAAGPGPAPDPEEVRIDPSKALPAAAIPRDPATYVALARRQRKLRDDLALRWNHGIAELELERLATTFRSFEDRWALVRWFRLRDARAEVRAVLAGGKLPAPLTIAADLDAAAEERATRRLLGEAATSARRWFGQLAGRDVTESLDLDGLDLDEVDAALTWARELRAAFDAVPILGSRDAAWRALVAQVSAPARGGAGDGVLDTPASEQFEPLFGQAAAAVDAWQRALARLAELIGVDAGALDGDRGHLAALIDQVAIWRGALPHLIEWARYVRARAAARGAGLGPVVDACESGELPTEQAGEAWERALLLALVGDRIAVAPTLAGFHGPTHHARASEIFELTRAAQVAVRSRLLARLVERVPRKDREPATEALARELERAVPRAARELLAEVAPLLPRLAPCVIATPAAVAAQLPATPRFDLVVVLDAGALPAAAGVSALARAEAAIVFGGPEAGSVFAEAVARFPLARLSTSYRTRHEDLIAFAGARWFDDRIRVFPAAHARSPVLGASLRAIDPGADAAAAVADAVIAHVRDPEQARRSLAVVGFDRGLVARIADHLDAARAADPEIERALAAAEAASDGERGEGLLLADTAVLDGEARDVVLLAIDQPLEPAARVMTALTCAREQLVVMSSVAAPDAGHGDLTDFLAFAAEAPARPLRESAPASPLCVAIAAALTQRGWIVRHQVGAGPARVDLAIVDPDDSGRYVLAIETDGVGYAAAGAAADRDRLRAMALAENGWRLHRIWCLDWWTDPDREAQRAHGAVVAAIAAARQARRGTSQRVVTGRAARPEAGSAPIADHRYGGSGFAVAGAADGAVAASAPVAAASGPERRLARGSRPTATGGDPELVLGLAPKAAPTVARYHAASVPNGRRRPDDMFEPRHAEELGKLIDRVIEVEAPIHLALLARRVAAYFGVGKVTPRITEAVAAAAASRTRASDDEPGVLWRLDQDPTALPAVRVASDAIESRRDIDEVPLVEIVGAAVVVVDRTAAAPIGNLVRDAARLLGYARITDRVIERVRLGVELAAKSGAIRIDGERAVSVTARP